MESGDQATSWKRDGGACGSGAKPKTAMLDVRGVDEILVGASGLWTRVAQLGGHGDARTVSLLLFGMFLWGTLSKTERR